jgi:transcriptional regulator with XRE-family HTH domain
MGLTQVQFAARCGISQRHLSDLELHRCAPSAAVALRLWKALDRCVPLEVILGEAPVSSDSAQQKERRAPAVSGTAALDIPVESLLGGEGA